MKWINTKGKERKWPDSPGQIVVKTFEGKKTVFHHTGTDISKILLSDQYDFWLDESPEPEAKRRHELDERDETAGEDWEYQAKALSAIKKGLETNLIDTMEECERLAGLVKFWQTEYYKLNPTPQPGKIDNL